MAPLRGWAPCGERLIAKVPHGRWKTTTFLAALRHDRIDAPWLLEGPIDGESFRTYVEKVLLPTLREGDIVIMDNLGSHKGKAVRALIRSAGAKLFFLPKYSPDLNPIEQVLPSSTSTPQGSRTNRRCSAPPSANSLTPSHPKNARITSKLRLMPSRLAKIQNRTEHYRSRFSLSVISVSAMAARERLDTRLRNGLPVIAGPHRSFTQIGMACMRNFSSGTGSNNTCKHF